MYLDENFQRLSAAYVAAHPAAFRAEAAQIKQTLRRPQRVLAFPPMVLSPARFAEIERSATELVRLLSALPWRVFAGQVGPWMDFLGLDEAARALLAPLASAERLRQATCFARPDMLPTASGFRATEINVASCIGGMGMLERYLTAFQAGAFGRYLAAQGMHASAPPTGARWRQALAARTPVAGRAARPVIFEARANPADSNSGRANFIHMAEQAGFQVRCGLIGELTLRADGVYAGAERIHTVYAMFTWDELRRFVPAALLLDLSALEQNGKVDLVLPLVTALFDHKANFEILSDPAFAHAFTAEEQQLLRRSIPATFRLRPETLADALAGQDQLVLKPTSQYGGKGIVIGKQVTAAEWRQRLAAASELGGYVCQQIVPDLWVRPALAGDDCPACLTALGPIVFDGRFSGVYLRQMPAQAATPVINAANGAEDGIALGVMGGT